MKRLFCLMIAIMGLFAFSACGSQEIKTESLGLGVDDKYNGMYIEISIEDFNNLGFEYGDSVDIEFSNGYKFEDVAYYNGFYGKKGTYELVAYQGYQYLSFAENGFGLPFEVAGVTEEDTAVISLRKKGKYSSVQTAFNLEYSVNRDDYPSDEVFANFRACAGGGLKENVLYRSASPIDDQYNRASYVYKLMEGMGIKTVLDLADSEAEVKDLYKKDTFDISYHQKLMDEGNVICASLSANYRDPEYCKSLTESLKKVMRLDRPVLVHCVEGKDRTGFVCALLEGLCGASYDEMVADYMTTYDNYYGITKSGEEKRYSTIEDAKFEDIALCIGGRNIGESFDGIDYEVGARAYLINGGMTNAEVDELIDYLTK